MSLKDTFKTLVKGNEDKISYKDPTSRIKITKGIDQLLNRVGHLRPIIVVSIGTDRSTGDSLGPLVGTRLSQHKERPYIIYGTLDQPVHAVNLRDKIQEINQQYQNPFIIAVDACLGRHYNIGMITVNSGPVIPGAGVKKDLPPVGHMHITGIVNVSGYMEYIVLQNTRLSLVMNMAEIISDSLHRSLTRHYIQSSSAKVNIK